MGDYKFKTTFWNDFTITEKFGKDAIQNTYAKAFEGWKHDVVYLTELVLVLNWKLWKFWEDGNEEIANLYNDLWQQTDAYCVTNLEKEELKYFLETTD
jgi:hypothetical protein